MAQKEASGYVIGVENSNVYVDLSSADVSPGTDVGVFSGEEYFTHPVTGERIRKEPERIAVLKIEKTFDQYSLATVVSVVSGTGVEVGMVVRASAKKNVPDNFANMVEEIVGSVKRDGFAGEKPVRTALPKDGKVPVVVAPAQVNDIVGIGYFGTYVSDILMEQLMMCDKVRLLDRSILQAQLDEIGLTQDAYIDPKTSIQQGKIAGARYIVQVTMQKPDVVNIRTGIPLASIMGAISGATGKNIGAQYASNLSVEHLKAAVSVSARVVDLQTGEVVFMSSGTGHSQGKAQLSMEYGALSGAQLNGGAEGFKQTVTGQAIQKAFVPIGRNLNLYFNGQTTQRVMGSASGYGNYSEELKRRGVRLYVGTERQTMDDLKTLFADNPHRYFRYKAGKRLNTWSVPLMVVGAASLGVGLAGGINTDFGEFGFLCAGGAVCISGGVVMRICGRKTVKKVVNDYNRDNRRTTSSWSIVSDNHGIGLRHTF